MAPLPRRAGVPTLLQPLVSTDRVDDAALVARARQGDQGAFGELVDRHRVAVYRAALAALGSHADADDAAQDAFVKAYQRLKTFRGEASFRTWLLAIAWRQALNRRRGLRRLWKRFVTPASQDGRGPGEGGIDLVAIVSPDATPEEAVRTRELAQSIGQALRNLSRPQRDALLLASAGEYTYEEIGTMLGVPTGTIKWRVSEARRLVRLKLQDQ